MALTNPSFDVNNIQSLADQPTETATEIKVTFDKTGSDAKTYLLAQNIELDALDTANVKLTGVQTVAGVKTFSSSPVVPVATTDLQAPQKVYVDDADAVLQGFINTNITDIATNAADIVGVVLGAIPDGSLTDVKLSDTAGQIKDKVDTNTTAIATVNTELNEILYASIRDERRI